MPLKPWVKLATGLVFWLFAAGIARGQGAAPTTPLDELTGRPVVLVEVSGTKRVPAKRIKSRLQTRVGKPYSPARIDFDVRRIWEFHQLVTVVQARETGQGVAIRFQAFELSAREVYPRFELSGLKNIEKDEALKIMRIREGLALSYSSALAKRKSLLERYDRLGYIFAQIKLVPSPDRRTLVFSINEGPCVKVRSISLEGNKSFPTDVTVGLEKNVLGSAGVVLKPTKVVAQSIHFSQLENWFLLPWIIIGEPIDWIIPNPEFSRVTLAADLERIRQFYRGEGYKEARAEVADVVFTADRTAVDIKLLIDEGPRYRISSVEIQQLLPPGREKPLVDKDPILAKLRVKPGMYYELGEVQRNRALIKSAYGERGFPSLGRGDVMKAEETFQLLPHQEIFDAEKATVAIIYRLREGYPKKVRKIRITGNRNTKEEVIRREISLHPGDPLDMMKLQRSLYQLDALQYFDSARGASSVKKSLKSVPGSPEEVDLDIDLQEGKSGNLLWSAGVSTNWGFFGKFTLRRRNFDISRTPTGANPVDWLGQIIEGRAFYGGGQTLTLDLQPGSKYTFFNIKFHEPDILGRHEEPVSFTVNAFKRWRFFPEYRDERLGGTVRLGRRFGRRTFLSAGFKLESMEVKHIEADAPFTVWDSEGRTECRTLDLQLRHDGTDHPLQPTSGYTFSLNPSLAGTWLGGEADFWGTDLEGRVYYPVWEDGRGRKHVLSLRGNFRWNKPIGDSDDLHISHRFFLGGRGTIRGFRFRDAGPMQFDNPMGGEAMWTSSFEYLIPLYSIQPERGGREVDMVRLVFFADAGGLGTTINSSTFGETRLAVGFGFRARIPGLSNIPVALDFGFPIFKEETDDTQVLSFVLGMF